MIGIIPTKYPNQGIVSTQSTDYACLYKIFRVQPLNGDEIFVDVGCGEGRVLTYLYLKGFKGKLIGVELDSDVATTAAERTVNCSNIEIINANIIDCSKVLKEATVYYLFNPFSKRHLLEFLEKIEENASAPLKLYYCNDLYKSVLLERDKWSVIREGTVKRLHAANMSYSIYSYNP